jgi:teichuronic acid biosynthesis glycosyltransferase TuaC
MTIRVLLFTNIYPSRQHPANGMWLLEQVRSLRQKGLEFDVVHFNPKDTRLSYLIGLRELVRHIRARRYDILHTHDAYTFYLAYFARVLAAASLPIVLTIHEQELLAGQRTSGEVSPLSLLRRSVFVRRLAASKADFVIFVYRKLLEIVSPRGPAVVIPCGVDLDRFRPLDRQSCRRQLGIPPDAVVVFSPADAHVMRKRVNLAQEAFKIFCTRVAGNAILIVGGKIPHERMPLYYNAADVVLQTSLREASPTIVKEALACEVPIVSTDAGDTRELLGPVPHCYVCEDDPDRLAHHLQMGLTREARGGQDRLRAQGLALDQVADQVIQVYHRVLSRGVEHGLPERALHRR